MTQTKAQKFPKTVLLKVDEKTHDQIKKLARFQGITIEAAAREAIGDWIINVIQSSVKPKYAEISRQFDVAQDILGTKK
jgi:hypothetical protein